MSRSTRKTPIMGITTCRSERDDKQIWHRRWRAHQRTALASAPLDDEDSKLPESMKQLSDIWDMGKDGRQYWPLSSQARTAKRFARRKDRGRKEREALEARLRHKFMGK